MYGWDTTNNQQQQRKNVVSMTYPTCRYIASQSDQLYHQRRVKDFFFFLFYGSLFVCLSFVQAKGMFPTTDLQFVYNFKKNIIVTKYDRGEHSSNKSVSVLQW